LKLLPPFFLLPIPFSDAELERMMLGERRKTAKLSVATITRYYIADPQIEEAVE
jgi:hypothetical protein